MLQNMDLHAKVNMGVMWVVSAFGYINNNLPMFIGWATLIYTCITIGLAIKKWRKT